MAVPSWNQQISQWVDRNIWDPLGELYNSSSFFGGTVDTVDNLARMPINLIRDSLEDPVGQRRLERAFNRGVQAASAAYNSGQENLLGAVVLGEMLMVADAVGVMGLNEAITHKELFTNRELSDREIVTRYEMSGIQLAQTGAMIYVGVSAAARGLAAEGRAALPEFDGQTTHGVLVTNEGEVLPLQSGNPSPTYANYPAAGHVEGKAALWIRENGSTGGVLYHNNPRGTCGFCNAQVPTLLPEGATLKVVAPEGTVPPPGWFNKPNPYMGNSAIPKPNSRLGGS